MLEEPNDSLKFEVPSNYSTKFVWLGLTGRQLSNLQTAPQTFPPCPQKQYNQNWSVTAHATVPTHPAGH